MLRTIKTDRVGNYCIAYVEMHGDTRRIQVENIETFKVRMYKTTLSKGEEDFKRIVRLYKKTVEDRKAKQTARIQAKMKAL